MWPLSCFCFSNTSLIHVICHFSLAFCAFMVFKIVSTLTTFHFWNYVQSKNQCQWQHIFKHTNKCSYSIAKPYIQVNFSIRTCASKEGQPRFGHFLFDFNNNKTMWLVVVVHFLPQALEFITHPTLPLHFHHAHLINLVELLLVLAHQPISQCTTLIVAINGMHGT